MALDRRRNDAYAAALARVITPESVVLDLGAGVGIHGLLAARLGAKRVYLVEPEAVIAVAEEAARRNGLQDRIICLCHRIEDVVLPEPVDVIVSALTGNLLFTEDLLPLLLRARDAYLKPGGVLLPDRATLELAPVNAPAIHQREIADWDSDQHDVCLAPARTYAANTVLFRWDRGDVTYLAQPRTVHTMDLATATYDALHVETEFTAHTNGLCHGLAGWFTMRLGERWLSTAPDAEATHWSPALLPLDPPLALTSGDTISARLDRVPYGDWTWSVASSTDRRRHSTMRGTPFPAGALRRAAFDYRPSITADGVEIQAVLARCDGTRSLAEIARSVHQQWPARYPTHEDALRFVQRIVNQFA